MRPESLYLFFTCINKNFLGNISTGAPTEIHHVQTVNFTKSYTRKNYLFTYDNRSDLQGGL
jgi:hypothetical protein